MTEFDHSYLCNPSWESIATFDSVVVCDGAVEKAAEIDNSQTHSENHDSLNAASIHNTSKAASLTPSEPKETLPQRGLGYALKSLFFRGCLSHSDEIVNPSRKAQRFRVRPGVRCLIAPVEQPEPVEVPEPAGQLEESTVADDRVSIVDKRSNPRQPGNSQVEVVVVPQYQSPGDATNLPLPALSTPIRGSVVILNRTGISLSLNAPVTVGSDVELRISHATFDQSCRLPAKVLRREQSQNLWLVACSFQQPLSDDLVQSFSQLILRRDIG
ncbi:MAG: PilZ domain-containing protein [Planctomycetaceae bacterium]